jgi:antitoxin component of MazEF toxin-antitoxin module
MKLPVEITSKYPMCIEIDADKFGTIFANMAADEQVATLAAMVEHMTPHQTQWDYISIELELPEHSELRRTLRDVLFPATH